MANAYKYKSGNETLKALPVAAATVIEVGDHVKLSTGLLVPVTGATDNLTAIGIAKEAHRAADPAGKLTVSIFNADAIFETELNAATDVTAGDTLQFSGAQKLAKSATDPVAIAMETKTGATKIQVIYKIPYSFIGDAA